MTFKTDRGYLAPFGTAIGDIVDGREVVEIVGTTSFPSVGRGKIVSVQYTLVKFAGDAQPTELHPQNDSLIPDEPQGADWDDFFK